jgi:uncharacterized protein (DUF2141 family)
MRRLAIIAAVLIWLQPAHADTGRLIIQVADLESRNGELRFALFDSKDDFMKNPVHAEVVAVEDNGGVWVIDELPYGTYAVLVYQDINANGEMERHWYGKPREPVGASNNPKARFGPPRFQDTRFELSSATLTLDIIVK